MSRQTNILDPIRDELAPSVWEDPAAPKPRLKGVHRHWIMSHVHSVLKSAGYTDSEKWLSLVLTGSLTTYQYGDQSDVDTSLFVDTKVFPDWSRAELIGLMISKVDGTTLPGTTYPMQCFVVDSHKLGKTDLYKAGMRSGYDINEERWIVPPERERAHNVEAKENGFYVYALQMADKMEHLLRYEPDKAVMFWHQLHGKRHRDQAAGKGDFSESNIIYKFLSQRNLFPAISEASGEYIAKVAAPMTEWPMPGHESSTQWHYNEWTGKRCHCPWGRVSHPKTISKVAGADLNKVLKDPAKVFRTPEGQAFKQALPQHIPEDHDSLAPYIAHRWKKGEIKLHEPTNTLYTQKPLPREQRSVLSPNIYEELWRNEGNETPSSRMGLPGQTLWHPLSDHLPEWSQWYNARQHPTRRGVNVMDPNFSVHEMGSKAAEHREALEREAQIKEDLSYGKPVHHFANGWHVRHLNANNEDAYPALEGEGKAMDHCIGYSASPDYRNWAHNGDINVYSLRDKKGWPHGTWHTNPDGSVAEVFGHNDTRLSPEQHEMYAEWCKANGTHPDTAGNHNDEEDPYEDEEDEDQEPEHDESVDTDPVESVHYYHIVHTNQDMSGHFPDDANVGDDTELNVSDPSWKDVLTDLHERSHPWHSDPLGAEGRKQFYDEVSANGHMRDMNDAMERYRTEGPRVWPPRAPGTVLPPLEPHEQQIHDEWADYTKPYYHPLTGEMRPGHDEFGNSIIHDYQGPLVQPNLDRPHPDNNWSNPVNAENPWTYNAKTSRVVLADKLHGFLMNPKSRPDLQTPEGQGWLQDLERLHRRNPEHIDPLTPWLTREWKKKRVSPYAGGLGYSDPNGGEQIASAGDLSHWADFYHSKHPVRRGLGDIMQHDIGSFHGKVHEWDQAMKDEIQAKALQGGKVVHTTPDGYTIRQLTTPEELTAEGDAMGHCVGGYHDAVKRGRSMIYSLRDAKGMPHATTEIEPSEFEPTRVDVDRALETNPVLRAIVEMAPEAKERFRELDRQHHDTPLHVLESMGDKNETDYHSLYAQMRKGYAERIPSPNNGKIVQIQGKGNEEPIPEYQKQLKHWFHNGFHDENRPTWDDEDGEYLYHPGEIQDRHLHTSEQDAYGLVKQTPDFDWNGLVNNTLGDGYDGYDYGDRVYELAKAHGQIPEFATAVQQFGERQQDSFDQWREMNYDHNPHPDEEDFEDPEDYEQAMKNYYDEETSLASEHPGMEATNDMYRMLAPHYDPGTRGPNGEQGGYRNETQPVPQGTFSYAQ